MTGDTLTIVIFAGGIATSVFGWFLRQQIAAQQGAFVRLERECEANRNQIQELQREQHNFVTRQEMDELRSGIKADLGNMRRVEIKELYDLLRQETRQIRNDMRDDVNQLSRNLVEQIKQMHATAGKGATV